MTVATIGTRNAASVSTQVGGRPRFAATLGADPGDLPLLPNPQLRRLPRQSSVQAQQRGERAAQVAPRHDQVEQAVREQELGGLEALRQRLPGDLLDDA